MRRPVIIAVSGPIGSGKSTLCKSLADRWEAPIGSFGDYVRHLARRRRAAVDRQSLQDLGHRLATTGCHTFVKGFVSWAGLRDASVLVIDGLRHVCVAETLAHYASLHRGTFLHVHLHVEERERRGRLRRRGAAHSRIFDDHPVERSDGELLRRRAGLVLKSSPPHVMADAVQAALMALSRRLPDAPDPGAALPVGVTAQGSQAFSRTSIEVVETWLPGSTSTWLEQRS